MPRTVALVLWGSDNIKTDGAPIGQALALIGARPRFDSFGRLAGADLVPLAELGRPRIDVVMTLSGIFRDLLPLQTRLLAEAAWLAASADEPVDQNFVEAHAETYAAETGVPLAEAALRVFSNAEGAYGSNVGPMVDARPGARRTSWPTPTRRASALPTASTARRPSNPRLLQKALKDVDLAYQNLESVELGRDDGRPLLRHAGRDRARGSPRQGRARCRSISATRRAAAARSARSPSRWRWKPARAA